MIALNLHVRHVTTLAGLCALTLVACADQQSPADETPSADTGQVELSLVGQAPSGNVYRLRDALVSVEGPGTVLFFDTEVNPDSPSLSAILPAGNYQNFLHDGWRLERLDATGTATTTQAELLSSNPGSFSVFANQNTRVALRFRADPDDIVLDPGSLDIVLDVEEVSNPLSPCITTQVGAARECGWSMAGGFEGTRCAPGEMVVIGCGCSTGGLCGGDPVLRVCEGNGSCRSDRAIGLVDDACGLCPETSFLCPVGGFYSVMVGSFVSDSPFVCEPALPVP